MNPLQQLETFGQSIWLDFITRDYIASGNLKKLIDSDGFRGVTSNPTIFQKAITGSRDYDADMQAALRAGRPTAEIFEALAVADIQRACDVFKDVFEKTQGADGFVSIEVNPLFARKTQETLEEVRRLHRSVARPNLMVKIPATKEGLPAIEQSLTEGININITLIFSLERYLGVLEAWLKALENRVQKGLPIDRLASVASFFVSRVDVAVDKALEKTKAPQEFYGKAAIANAQLAYALFEETARSPRFQKLREKGARVQRPLWASTGTKNPKYRDVLYVEELIGADTVNTLPPQTLDAFRDHGKPRRSLPADAKVAQSQIDRLKDFGIDLDKVTEQLEVEGVKLFEDSYNSLLQGIEAKKEALVKA